MKTRIGILGAGSIGCYLGGMLAAKGCDVVFIGREALQQDTQNHGLTLSHFSRDTLTLSPYQLRVETSVEALSDRTVILLCTKSQDTELAAKSLNQVILPEAHIISCQNGISNVPILQELLGEKIQRISGAIIPFNVTRTAPAQYHCGTDGAIRFEQDIPHDMQLAFAEANQAYLCGGNFKGDQWAKLLVNLNNALNTLNGGTLRECFAQKHYRFAFAAIVEEGLKIANAHNIEIGHYNGRTPSALLKTLRLPNWGYQLIMRLIVKMDAKARSSMLDDLESGRVSEIDYLQGEIIRQAEAIGLTAPHNQAILQAVNLAFEKGYSPKLSGKDIWDLIGNSGAMRTGRGG